MKHRREIARSIGSLTAVLRDVLAEMRTIRLLLTNPPPMPSHELPPIPQPSMVDTTQFGGYGVETQTCMICGMTHGRHLATCVHFGSHG